MLYLSKPETYDGTRSLGYLGPVTGSGALWYQYISEDRKGRQDSGRDRREENKKKKGEKATEILFPLLRTPSLTVPTLVVLRNPRIASEKDSLPSESPTGLLIGLT